MIKSIFLAVILSASFLQNLKAQSTDSIDNIIKSLPKVVDPNLIKEMGLEKKVEDSNLSKKERIKREFELFKQTIENIDNEKLKTFALNKYEEGMRKLEQKDNFTVIYFVSPEEEDQNIKMFMEYIDVLNSHFKNIKGRIFFYNYPDNLVETINGSIKVKVKPFSSKTSKGYIELNEDGSYAYKISKINGLKVNEKYNETIYYEQKDGQKSILNIALKANKNGELKIVGKTIIDSMLPYLRNLREKNIGSSNVKFNIHPWAYDRLNLKEVPAYLLTYCDEENFSFRECENKFIAKGNISLDYFMELVSQKDKTYDKYFEVFKEGKNENTNK